MSDLFSKILILFSKRQKHIKSLTSQTFLDSPHTSCITLLLRSRPTGLSAVFSHMYFGEGLCQRVGIHGFRRSGLPYSLYLLRVESGRIDRVARGQRVMLIAVITWKKVKLMRMDDTTNYISSSPGYSQLACCQIRHSRGSHHALKLNTYKTISALFPSIFGSIDFDIVLLLCIRMIQLEIQHHTMTAHSAKPKKLLNIANQAVFITGPLDQLQ